MNTSQGVVTDVDGQWSMSSYQEDELRELLQDQDAESVSRFVRRVNEALVLYQEHRRARAVVADSQRFKRWLSRMKTQADKFLGRAEKLSRILDEAPFDLRRAASRAGVNIETIQNNLANLMACVSGVRDLTDGIDTKKDRYHPETGAVIRAIGEAFEDCFGVKPLAVSPQVRTRCLPDRFVNVIAIVLSVEVISAYREVRALGYHRGMDIDQDTLALLSNIRDSFDGERMASRVLVQKLIAKGDGPWSMWADKHESSAARELAALLRPLGIAPAQIRIDGKVVRGYRRSDFEMTWSVYLAG